MFQKKIKDILRMPNQKIDPGMMNQGQIEQLLIGLSKVLHFNIDGDIVELGCNVGESSKYLRVGLNTFKSDKKLWVYDSFEGLPELSESEIGTPWKPGTLKTSEDVLVKNFTSNNIPPPDHIIKSWFKDIREDQLPQKICFAFLDGDFYSSIYESLDKIYDKVSDGGYIFLHDYNRPDLPGVKRAVDDFLASRGEDNFVFSVCNQLGVLIKGRNKKKKHKKLGFLHIPRTGGTHLERVLNVLGPRKFINFFGAPHEDQLENHIPIIETMKPGDQKHQRFKSNPNLNTCKLFAGHFSHNIEDCFDEDVDFFTILRDPIQRVTSMTKQFLTSRIYSEILRKNSNRVGDDIFWSNLEDYLNKDKTEGLLTHEFHGFRNYMTKVIAGCDISDPNISVDESIFQKAKDNLSRMRYFGFFEDYEQTIEDVLCMLDLDTDYQCGPLKKSSIPESTNKIFTELNKYDIELYKYAKRLKSIRSQGTTFVTALLDINRDDLSSNLFHRKFETYLDKLKILLENLKDKNLVIYIEEEYFDFVKNIKPHNVILKTISQNQIRNSEYYEKIQTIRNNPDWFKQKGWLENSPQAKLELYNPLIFEKIHFLENISQINPFNDSSFVWVDAGIANSQASPSVFKEDWFDSKIKNELNKFLFINYPYKNFTEIHGFKKEGLDQYHSNIESVTRATFFGGKPDYISFFSKQFNTIAKDTLNKGYLGTEESIYTILNYIFPKKINSRKINHTGLVRNFFENIKKEASGVATPVKDGLIKSSHFKPEPYNNIRNQQNPKAFDAFKNFFSKNTDIDLIIEIGTGFGGFSSFLYEQSKSINSSFITYDINKNFCDNLKKLNHNIDVRNKNVFDIFTINEIECLVNKHKKTLILCDGGNVLKEFKTFTPILKQSDIIMGHDYAPNKQVFQEKYINKIWNWMEISDPDIELTVKENRLVNFHPELNNVAWVSKVKTKPKENKSIKSFNDIKTNLYFLTFNYPEQLEATIKILSKSPDFLSKPNQKIIIDNSTKESAREGNKLIAEKYGFDHIIMNKNLGICGGRQFAAEHFHESDSDFYIFFEDDMTINNEEDSNSLCRNGLRKYVPNLYNTIHKIMLQENYDFLKLSFTEVYFDNDKQCSWYNVPQEVRSEVWPHYDKLPEKGLDPNVPLTEFKNIRNIDGCSYIDGQVYYANWPHITSRSGNQKMFINTKWARPYEQTWMSYIFRETLKGNIKPAILLASTVTHDRFKHYKPEERVES